MKSNWVDFASVKQAVPILAVLQRYQIRGLKKTGAEYRGRCPIHKGDSEDSFHVNVEKNCFQCFAGRCRKRGNVLDLVAAMENCSVRDAAVRLQDWFGLGDGTSSPRASSASADSKLAREERAGETNPSTDRGANDGPKGPNKPLGFELRGIDHGAAYLTDRGISKETAEYFGVGLFSGKGSMSGRVVIPIHNGAGELLAYAGRSVDNTEPRYKLPAGFHKSLELYNLHRAIGTGQRGLIVVEGFFDCMKVHQAGFGFVVALMGCSMSEEQESLLVAHAEMVLVMLDGDEAGRQGTEDLLARLGRRVWVKSAELPEGRQPDQMTAEEIQAVLRK
jgi:DNA primase